MPLTFTSSFFTGSVSDPCISGSTSGSFSGSVCGFTGSLYNFTGILTGFASGSYSASVNTIQKETFLVLKRSLLKFDVSSISSSIANGNVTDPKFFLNLKTVESTNVPLDYKIYAYPISQSWNMGTGVYAYGGSSDGVNWNYRKYPDSSSFWYPNIDETSTTSVDYLTTETTASFLRGGGTWYYSVPAECTNSISQSFCSDISASTLICSQSFSYNKSDIKLDITNICKAWICGCIPNEGLILITSEELNSTSSLNLKFFSRETNTIYSPYIDVQWDDVSFETGSLLPITSSLGVDISLKNLKTNYKHGSIAKVDVFSREKSPQKQFVQIQTVYNTSKYLPTSSYYAVKDNESEEIIIDFDEYTKLSCDSTSNYFYLDTTSLSQERYYKILIKCEFDDGSIQIFEDNKTFKISR